MPCPVPGDLPNPGIEPTSSTLQMDSLPSETPGKPMNTGVGSLSILQGIFPIQGLNPDFPAFHCRQILYCLSQQGSPRILEWVAYPFSRGSSQPGIELRSPALQVDSLPAELPGKPRLVFIMVQPSHLYKTTGKNHSFDQTDLCQQSDISAF